MPSLIPLKVHLPLLAAIPIPEQPAIILQIKNLNPFLRVEVVQQEQQHFVEDPTELIFMTCLIRLVHFAVERAGQLLLLESPVKNHLSFLVFR